MTKRRYRSRGLRASMAETAVIMISTTMYSDRTGCTIQYNGTVSTSLIKGRAWVLSLCHRHSPNQIHLLLGTYITRHTLNETHPTQCNTPSMLHMPTGASVGMYTLSSLSSPLQHN